MGRAQVSVFIIIGVAIIMISSILFYKLNEAKIRDMLSQDSRDSAKPVKDHVQACLKQTMMEALAAMGEQGRVYPQAYLASGEEKISYFYFQGKDYFPALEDEEQDIARFVEEHIPGCIGEFRRSGYIIKEDLSGIRASAAFDNSTLKVSLNYPIEVYADGEKKIIEEFNEKAFMRFTMLHGLSEKIYNEASGNPEWINLDFSDYPFEVSIIKVNKYTLVYEITDAEYGLDARPYTYRFAIKYGL